MLWFRFSENEEDKNPLIGLEYHLQASGTQAFVRSNENNAIKVEKWNKASDRRLEKAKGFEDSLGQ